MNKYAELEEKLKIEAIKKLTPEERLMILASMADAIAEEKIKFMMETLGVNRQKAIEILRSRLLELEKLRRGEK